MTWPSWQLIGPQDMREWKAAGLLLLGGYVGWLISPLLWFAWGPMRWGAFLLASAAQESGFDPEIEGEAEELGILQFTANSPFVLGIAPNPATEEVDWRLSPFWSGYYAARYYQAQAWLAPGLLLLWLVPVLGSAAARFTWTHDLASYGVSGVAKEAYASVYDVTTDTSGERAFRWSYPLWWTIFHLPCLAVAVSFLELTREARSR